MSPGNGHDRNVFSFCFGQDNIVSKCEVEL